MQLWQNEKTCLKAHSVILLFYIQISVFSQCEGYSFGTHKSMAEDSLEIVDSLIPENENEIQSIMEEIKAREDIFMDGSIEPDLHGGSILGFLPRSSFSHFYNPTKRSGFSALHPMDWGDIPEFLLNLGVLSPYISQAVGPAIPATSMATWYYSRALNEYFGGEIDDAVHSLGFVIHYIQDTTVPQHATDCGAESPSCMHTEYEVAVDERFRRRELKLLPNVTYEELSSLAQMDVDFFVEEGAEQSHDLLQDASENRDEWFNVADKMVPLGIELGAAVTLKYIQDIVNQNVDFDSFVLMIDKVELLQLFGKANLQPVVHVKIQNSTQKIDLYNASVMTNARVAEPQRGMDATGWTFVHTLTDSDIAYGFVTFELEMYDRKGDDDTSKKMKVVPDGGTLLDITISLDEKGAITETSMGCEGSSISTACYDSVSVTYTVGRSSYVDIEKIDYGLPFVLRSVSILELVIIVVLLVIYLL